MASSRQIVARQQWRLAVRAKGLQLARVE
jgi:hypothetical protein